MPQVYFGLDIADDDGEPVNGSASIVIDGVTTKLSSGASGFDSAAVFTGEAAVTVTASGSTYWDWEYDANRQAGTGLTMTLDVQSSATLTIRGRATSPPPPPPPPPPPATYSISGTINQSPQTVARRVSANLTGETAGYWDDTVTGETPSYSITGLPAGTYTVILSLGTGEASDPSSISVTVGPNATGQDFDVTYTPPPPTVFTIAGTVTQGSGSPARRLYATPTGGSEGYFDLTASGKNPTYSIPNVAAGTYVVMPELFAGEAASPTSISVTVGPNATGKDFTISSNPTALYKVRLVEEDGSPVTGAVVTIDDITDTSELDSGMTDVDGYRESVAVPVGHTVQAAFTAAGTWTWSDTLGDNSGTGSTASIVMPSDAILIVFTRATPP
jgi:hypothetical protein